MTELAVVEDPTAFNIDRTVQGPDRFRIGSTRHGYIYTKMPGGYVWKCERAAAGEDAGMPGQVLFIFKTQKQVFEVHRGDEHMMSSQEVEEAYMAYQTNLVFGCDDEEMLTAGNHVWDSFDNKKRAWKNHTDFKFGTVVLAPAQPYYQGSAAVGPLALTGGQPAIDLLGLDLDVL